MNSLKRTFTLLLFALCVFVGFGTAVPLSVRADLLTGAFDGQPLPLSSDPSSGMLLGYTSNGSLALYVSADPANTSPVYAALYNPISGTSNYTSRVYASAEANQTVHWCYINVASGVVNNTGTNSIAYQQDSLYVLYYENAQFSAGYNSSVAGFDTLSNALAGIRDYIDNQPPVIDPNDSISAFYLPAGNVAYINVSNTALPYSVTLRQDFEVLSSLIGEPWNSNQTFGWAVAEPGPSMSYPRYSSVSFSDESVDWDKQAPTNVFGQTTNGVKVYTGESLPVDGQNLTAKYAVVFNPLYSRVMGRDQLETNKAIRIIVKGAASIRVYPLTATVSMSGVSNVISGDYSTGDIEEQGGQTHITWDKEPHFGGNNEPPADESADNAIQRLLQGILGIFNRGGQAISSLINAGSEFMSNMGSLFSWMPPPLLDVVVSAVVLFVIIGVLKLLL